MKKINVVKELKSGALSKNKLFQCLDYESKMDLSSELIRLQAAGLIERQDEGFRVLYGLPAAEGEYVLTREMRDRMTQGRSVKACHACGFFGVISNSVKKCPDCGGVLFKPDYVLESGTPHVTERGEVSGEEAGDDLESEAESKGGDELIVPGGVVEAETGDEDREIPELLKERDKLRTLRKQATQRYIDAEATIAELKRDVEQLRGGDAPEPAEDLVLVEVIEKRTYVREVE